MPEVRSAASSRLPKIRAWIDRSSWTFLVFLGLSWTIIFTVAYASFTMRNRGDGLKIEEYPEYRWVVRSVGIGKPSGAYFNPQPNPIPWQTAFLNALYFSIATETTVGYGDLVPHGVSRFLACAEALGGLMLAGVFVAKITTGLTGKTKILVGAVEGQWIEFSVTKENCLPNDCVIISLITIRYIDGLLHYDGRNYDWDGRYRRGFEGTSQPLGTIDGPTIWFDYTNLRGDKEEFKEGKSRLRFNSLDAKTKQYMAFEGKAEDSGRQKDIPMFGFRAAQLDARTIRELQSVEPESKEMCCIASKAFVDHLGDIREFASEKGVQLVAPAVSEGCDAPNSV